jgi:hypothetical protein
MSAIIFERRTLALGAGFFFVFMAFSTSQLLASSLMPGEGGLLCLFLIYGFFALANLSAPFILSRASPDVDGVTLPLVLSLSAVCYALLTASYLVPGGEGMQLFACAAVGVGGGTLWCAQGTYIGIAAAAHARTAGCTRSQSMTRLNSLFHGVFMMSGGVSNFFASVLLLSMGGSSGTIALLFSLLTCCGAVGVGSLLLLAPPTSAGSDVLRLPCCRCCGGGGTAAALLAPEALPPPDAPAPTAAVPAAAPDVALALWAPPLPGSIPWPDDEGDKVAFSLPRGGSDKVAFSPPRGGSGEDGAAPATAPEPAPAPAAPTAPPSPLFMLRFILTERRVQLVAPMSFAVGAGQGFVLGVWMSSAVAGVAGAEWVGLVGASFSISSALTANAWGRCAARPAYGRRRAFAACLALLLAWYVVMAAAWLAMGGDAQVGARPAGATAPPATVVGLVVAILVFSSTDPVTNGFTTATMQNYFPSPPQLNCAVAAPRFFYAVGFSLQQILSMWLRRATGRPCVAEQSAELALLVVVAAVSLRALNRAHPIDGSY